MVKDSIQLQLALIPHEAETEIINQRLMDGYINGTALCKASNKKFNDYSRLASIQTIIGGTPEHQGTWVHRKNDITQISMGLK